MTTIRIFHVDDEPWRINWIPAALRSTYYSRHPDRFAEADVVEESDDENGTQTFAFTLCGAAADGEDVRIEYTAVDHENCLPPYGTLADALIILDLMRSVNGELQPTAESLYADLRAVGIDGSRVYLLTGYSTRASIHSFPGVPESHVLQKPIGPVEISELLLKGMPEIKL